MEFYLRGVTLRHIEIKHFEIFVSGLVGVQ